MSPEASRWRRAATTGVALVVLALVPGATPAGAARTTLLATTRACAPGYRAGPSLVMLSCADANSYLGSLRWTSWTRRTAVGSGEYMRNPCQPTCVASSVRAVASIGVVASLPVTARGVTFFTRLTVRRGPGAAAEVLKWKWTDAPGLDGYWAEPSRGWLS